MEKFNIIDRTNGRKATTIVIRRHGMYVNALPKKELEAFMRENLPSGFFKEDKEGVNFVPDLDRGNSATAFDHEGERLPIGTFAAMLGYTFTEMPLTATIKAFEN